MDFVATTASNSPKLRDLEAARKVLAHYKWDGAVKPDIELDHGQARLAVYGFGWPGAWRMPDGLDPEKYKPDRDVDSEDGFADFLKEMLPYLAEPLTVHAVGTENCRFPISACEWHVRPCTTEVEVNGFHYGRRKATLQLDRVIRASMLVIPCTIDWSLLARQKQWLITQASVSEEAAGLINLLDVIQDEAVKRGGISAGIVFPDGTGN